MLLDAYDYLDISCLCSRDLIPLPVECHYVLIGSSRLDIDFQFLLPVEYLLSLAFLADISWVNPLSLAGTVFAWLLDMLIHAGTQHHHLLHNTTSFARRACLYV